MKQKRIVALQWCNLLKDYWLSCGQPQMWVKSRGFFREHWREREDQRHHSRGEWYDGTLRDGLVLVQWPQMSSVCRLLGLTLSPIVLLAYRRLLEWQVWRNKETHCPFFFEKCTSFPIKWCTWLPTNRIVVGKKMHTAHTYAYASTNKNTKIYKIPFPGPGRHGSASCWSPHKGKVPVQFSVRPYSWVVGLVHR